MEGWVKNLVMLVFLAVWAIVMLVQLAREKMPEPLMWGAPGGLWFILNPTFRRPTEQAEDASPSEATP